MRRGQVGEITQNGEGGHGRSTPPVARQTGGSEAKAQEPSARVRYQLVQLHDARPRLRILRLGEDKSNNGDRLTFTFRGCSLQ